MKLGKYEVTWDWSAFWGRIKEILWSAGWAIYDRGWYGDRFSVYFGPVRLKRKR